MASDFLTAIRIATTNDQFVRREAWATDIYLVSPELISKLLSLGFTLRHFERVPDSVWAYLRVVPGQDIFRACWVPKTEDFLGFDWVALPWQYLLSNNPTLYEVRNPLSEKLSGNTISESTIKTVEVDVPSFSKNTHVQSLRTDQYHRLLTPIGGSIPPVGGSVPPTKRSR